jgi:hypothetical protein
MAFCTWLIKYKHAEQTTQTVANHGGVDDGDMDTGHVQRVHGPIQTCEAAKNSNI